VSIKATALQVTFLSPYQYFVSPKPTSSQQPNVNEMSNESLVQSVDTDDGVEDQCAKREENRKRVYRLLNPTSMSAEQNKRVKGYPSEGWQDEGCIGRWDGFRALWGTYKIVPEQDHALEFLTYVPENIGRGPSPLLISWHGGGFVS
jgi:hypothetical protein